MLRALNKEDGPGRIIKSSYGFLRTETYNPDALVAHSGVHPTLDKLDGYKYVRNTIEWLVKVVSDLPEPNYVSFLSILNVQEQTILAQEEYKIRAYHTIPVSWKSFKCEEILYVSDVCTESHYRKSHEKNKTAEEAGRIVVDMAPLVAQGRVRVKNPKPGFIGQPHYKFKFDLVIKIDGRNLTFEARWPAGKPTEVKVEDQISMAAAFQPGTD